MNKKILFMSLFFGMAAMVTLGGCTSKSADRGEASESAVAVEAEGAETADAESGATEWHDGLPTVIDFYATWCGPCKQISPLFDELRAQYGENINFCRVDVDADRAKAEQYHIEAMPTFVILDKEGNEINRIVGADPEALRKAVEDLKTKN